MLKNIGLALIFTLCVAASSADKNVLLEGASKTAFLKAFKKSAKNVERLESCFSQERRVAVFDDVLKAEGLCMFSFPNKLRWEMIAPYKTIMIFDGKDVAKFDVKDGRLRKLNLGCKDILADVLAQITSWMRGDFTKTSGSYSLKIFKNKNGYLTRLVPKSGGMLKSVKAIELQIDPKKYDVSKVIIREGDDDFIMITFRDEKRNGKFPAGVFDLTRPYLRKGFIK